MDIANKQKKTKTSLSRRQKQIIQIITQMDSKPITVSAIAEKLKVSSRTILRELPLIEEWMSENDFRFSRKTGVGLQILEGPANLELIKELLEIEHTTRVLGKEERRRRLLGELLFSTEPTKAFSFTSGYGISEGTLFGDFDYLEEWLAQHDVRLIRKQGVGIYIEGEEKAIRQAIINAIFDLYDINQIMGILPIGQHIVDDSKREHIEYPPLLIFMVGDTRMQASILLEEFRNKLGVRFRDSALVGLYMRIALAIYRIRNGRVIEVPSPAWEELKGSREYEAVKAVQSRGLKTEGLHINENEVLCLTEFLSSARIWTDATFFTDPMRSLSIRQYVTSLVRIVENITGLAFQGNRILMDDLVSHFTTVIDRNHRDILLKYAQIAPVKKNYPEIFSAVETAIHILGDEIADKEVLEADTGFVVMHFAAAAERIQAEQEKVVVAVVCPLGVGASRMLASSLTRAIHNIEVRRTISAFAISAEELREEGVDLIVSTTELNTNFPHVTISKVLQPQDRVKVQNRIDEINRSRLLRKTNKTSGLKSGVGLEDIRRISLITAEITELIENFRILQLMSVKKFGELLDQASKLFAGNDLEKKLILESFKKREQMGSTYIKELEIALLHCKAKGVPHSRFGYVRLEQPIKTEEGLITGAVVMIAPGHFSQEFLEPLSRLSALLIEETGFLQALKQGDTTTAVAYVEAALVKYYIQLR